MVELTFTTGEYHQIREDSCKAGIREVVEWVEHHLMYVALEYDGTPALHLQTNEHKAAEKWQAKLKEWGL